MTEKRKKLLTAKGVHGMEITLRAGPESTVKKAVIETFAPRLARRPKLLHLANPYPFRPSSDLVGLQRLGIPCGTGISLPDIVLLDENRGWVFLVEAVHSFGPISPGRLMVLKSLCAACKYPLVFVTAFLDRDAFRKFAPEIAWETEVWIAQEPDHMIHFNGDRFFGPRSGA